MRGGVAGLTFESAEFWVLSAEVRRRKGARLPNRNPSLLAHSPFRRCHDGICCRGTLGTGSSGRPVPLAPQVAPIYAPLASQLPSPYG
jgi:hypothetical protein